jgi:methylenetetrahydrofolate dehydrogenase (NADP+)/methenyltetrahydrofolate cyclohydrolase
MVATIINGLEIAKQMRYQIALQVEEIKQQFHITPTLAVILVGNSPASEVYVRNKEKSAHAIGMNSIQFKMTADISESDLINKIIELNNNKNVHGILVQLPLPKHINQSNIISTIDPLKDVDGFHIINVGKLSVGNIDGQEKAIIPCTPLGCMHLVKTICGANLSGLKALVIGSSNIVGRPLARLLMLAGCTVTIANRQTINLKAECLQADIIFSATGVHNLITSDMVHQNSVIIDIGIVRVADVNGGTKIVGDVDFENVKNIAKAISPVPGGVGPMTISYLLQNTIDCCLQQISLH